MKPNELGYKWRVGDKVSKTLHGLSGYREASICEIARIDKKTGTIYLSDGEGGYETGITYDMNGNEKERFFLTMYSEITPI